MAHNTRPLKRAQDGVAPQYYNPTTDEYEALHGTAGANHVVIYGPDGQPASLATETKLEAVRALLASLADNDFATQTTLAAVLSKLSADPSTGAKQDATKGVLDALDGKVATDAKLEAARALLASLDGKDYATQTTLAAVLAKLADPATSAKQDAAKVVLDAISTAVAARATEATLAQIKTALTDGTLKAQLSGSLLERYGATEAQRPAANSVPVGAVYMAVQTQQMWQSDGSQWVVM